MNLEVKTHLSQIGPAQEKMKSALDEFASAHPDTPINLAELGRELGFSRERARKLYNQIASFSSVPPKEIRSKPLISDEPVKQLWESGESLKSSAEILETSEKVIQKRRTKLRKQGAIGREQPNKKPILRTLPEEVQIRINARRSQVLTLRKQGLGTNDLAKSLGVDPTTINADLHYLSDNGENVWIGNRSPNNQEKITTRREKLAELLKETSDPHILMNRLHISEKTLNRDLQSIHERTLHELDTNKVEIIIFEEIPTERLQTTGD